MKVLGFLNTGFQEAHFGLFLVLPLHTGSLRQMMERGQVTHSISIKVLQILRKSLCQDGYLVHGDIKVIFGLNKFDFRVLLITRNEPENILVDYEVIDGIVSKFTCILADWGTSGDRHFGGTPFYAGPNTYEQLHKDLFGFGRLALELFLEQEGNSCHKKTFLLKTLKPLSTQQSLALPDVLPTGTTRSAD